MTPQYITDLLSLRLNIRTLRSSSQGYLTVPATKLKTYGDRAFSAAAPKLWNQLPIELRKSASVELFKKKLKTFLFKLAY